MPRQPPKSREKSTSDRLFELCKALPGVTEDVKWGDNLVFSVGGKMFAVFDLPDGEPFSFKVDPDAFSLLTQQPGIEPAPYLARHSWVSVSSRGVMPLDAVKDLLRESHAIVARKLSQKKRKSLGIDPP